MATNYRLLPRAEVDYFDIYTYGRLQFGEEQADAYTGGLRESFVRIAEYSHIGRNVSYLRTGYFRYDYKGHAIFYRLENGTVVIVRVLGSHQDFERHL